jgi:mannose-6-phosphate isomerase-like protein (cupin superfamily)
MPGSVACHDGDMEAVNLDAMLARFAERRSPKKIAQVNDYDIRIVKIQGEFTWHRHADTDEFFLVLDGQLTIQMRDGNVVLGPRELFVVPRSVEHCPRADTETAVLLFEPSTVINTGDAGGELTADVEELAGLSMPVGLVIRSAASTGVGLPSRASLSGHR